MNHDTCKEVKKVPYIAFSKCTHCGNCMSICPTHAIIEIPNPNCDKCVKYCITMKVNCSPVNYFIKYEDCINCGLCLSVCPSNAIEWVTNRNIEI